MIELETKQTILAVDLFKRLWEHKGAVVGLVIISMMILIAFFAPVLQPYPYDLIDIGNAYALPTWDHPFGTDELGRDILSRVMYGARYSLSMGLLTVILANFGGIIIGSLAGYFGGWVDNIIMRAADVMQAIPNLLMAIVISAVLGPGFVNSIIALTVSHMPTCARLMRASILSIRKMEYLEAATMINCSSLRIILHHVIPNALSPMIVNMTMAVAGTIMVAATLSFVGLGVQPPIPEWGAMLAGARNYMRDYPHLIIIPGLVLMCVVLSLNMLGDGLRDALDPKLKK